MYIKKYLFAIAVLIFQICMMYAAGIANPDLAGPDKTLKKQYGAEE